MRGVVVQSCDAGCNFQPHLIPFANALSLYFRRLLHKEVDRPLKLFFVFDLCVLAAKQALLKSKHPERDEVGRVLG